jgi:hypothetical protein
VVQKYEADKLVYSVARFLAGLKPKRGRTYYFEKFRSKLSKVIELKTKMQKLQYPFCIQCPFCRRTYRRSSTFITHIITVHYNEILAYIGAEYLVEPTKR